MFVRFTCKEDPLVNVKFGNTGIELFPLVFGSLPLGPLQANVSPARGGELIRHALDRGVNMIDTAYLYGTFAHVREGIRDRGSEVMVASKTHAADASTAREHVITALREIGRDRLDILLLHTARLPHPLSERAAVFDELCRMREEGLTRAIGVSSHYISAIRDAARNPDIDVIHPLINRKGMGILDGSAQEMARAIGLAASEGKGIYAMKALAGGNFISSARESISWVMAVEGVHALALGMLSEAEIEANVELVGGGDATGEMWDELEKGRRSLTIMRQFCSGCGSCIEVCRDGALEMVEGTAKVDPSACVLCGYCGAACPEFVIRVT
ncbi:MAG: aldo/keto reductase [Pseudomonadota bacterium]|jgi:aryl-alcohol dehydrogenase-like predicted oxidoreductase